MKVNNQESLMYKSEYGWLPLSIKNSGKITLETKSFQKIELVAGTGSTPKTYHSGSIFIGQLGISCTSLEIKEVYVVGNSNNDAAEKAEKMPGAFLITTVSHASAKVLCMFDEITHEGDFASYKELIPITETVRIASVEQAAIGEYLQVVIPSGNLYSPQLFFSGWKRPNQQEGCLEWLSEITVNDEEIRCNIPYFVPASDEVILTETGSRQYAQDALLAHLIRVYPAVG